MAEALVANQEFLAARLLQVQQPRPKTDGLGLMHSPSADGDNSSSPSRLKRSAENGVVHTEPMEADSDPGEPNEAEESLHRRFVPHFAPAEAVTKDGVAQAATPGPNVEGRQEDGVNGAYC
ncbi:unnamed protein product, partial [Protopolystoma xenopodis]